jgi:hypothetical protein
MAAYITLHVATGDEVLVHRDDIAIVAPSGTDWAMPVHTKIMVHDFWLGVRESYAEVKQKLQEDDGRKQPD